MICFGTFSLLKVWTVKEELYQKMKPFFNMPIFESTSSLVHRNAEGMLKTGGSSVIEMPYFSDLLIHLHQKIIYKFRIN